MKKFFVFIVGLFIVGTVFAVGENIPTSKTYVDNAVAQKQNTISANNGNAQVLTNTGTPGSIGTKNIYDSSAAYETQTNSLVTAATMNTAVQNAIDSEFVCIERNAQGECLLLEIRSVPQWSTLPTGYTALEYLESQGNQYIDTGYYPNTNTSVTVKYLFNQNTVNSWPMIFGADQSSARGPCYALYASHNIMTYTYSRNENRDNDIFITPVNYAGVEHIATCGLNNWSLDGTIAQSAYTMDAFNMNLSLYLFADNIDGDATFKSSGIRIYYFIIYDNETMVRNMTPARRDSDGVLGMYDLVSRQFFTNAGSGTFIAGPVAGLYLPNGN